MQGAHFCGLFSFVILIVLGIGLMLFTCIHYSDFWSLFSIISLIVAFICPNLCFAYDDPEMREYKMKDLSEYERSSMLELGWVFGGIFYLLSFLPPILAWYKAYLGWVGVLLIFGALTAWLWAFMFWLKLFRMYY